MNFTYDNNQQTIMGIHVDNYDNYTSIRDAVLFNYFEGFRPQQSDIIELVESAKENKFDRKRFEEIFRKDK